MAAACFGFLGRRRCQVSLGLRILCWSDALALWRCRLVLRLLRASLITKKNCSGPVLFCLLALDVTVMLSRVGIEHQTADGIITVIPRERTQAPPPKASHPSRCSSCRRWVGFTVALTAQALWLTRMPSDGRAPRVDLLHARASFSRLHA